jgi:hypothetical protein
MPGRRYRLLFDDITEQVTAPPVRIYADLGYRGGTESHAQRGRVGARSGRAGEQAKNVAAHSSDKRIQ